MSNMLRKIRRQMATQRARLGVTGSRQKGVRGAMARNLAQAKGGSAAKVKGAVRRALARFGMKMKEGVAVEG